MSDTKNTHTHVKNQVHFLDNLRSAIIFLVILYHAGGVYESSGIWAFFWAEW
jgi:peptidoglycan/LPS O-acetylase OafA/YrhL